MMSLSTMHMNGIKVICGKQIGKDHPSEFGRRKNSNETL
jgi:hypothetical protein